MEWVRSCFFGKWLLAKDRPDLVTDGFYVFAPDNVLHYRGWHNLGSRDWTSDERENRTALGEVDGYRRTYHDGVTDVNYPRQEILGSPTCIEQGETEFLSATDLIGGWSRNCYGPPIPVPPPEPPIVNVRWCAHQRQLGRVCQYMYFGGGSDARTLLEELYPDISTSLIPNGPGPYPGSLVGILGDLTIVVLPGTTNAQQWALQGFTGLAGPVDQGGYSTLLQWQSAASVMFRRVEQAGADPTGPIVLVGHSYGGAVAALMAARYRQANPGRVIQLLTFGMPKPGDVRLRAILATTTEVHLVNVDDPVPFIPPSGHELDILFAFLPGTLIDIWRPWSLPGNRIGLRPDGTRLDNPDLGDLYGVVYRAILQAQLGRRPAAFGDHLMSAYLDRLICPGDPMPSPSPPQWHTYAIFNGSATSYLPLDYRLTFKMRWESGDRAWGRVEAYGFNFSVLMERIGDEDWNYTVTRGVLNIDVREGPFVNSLNFSFGMIGLVDFPETIPSGPNCWVVNLEDMRFIAGFGGTEEGGEATFTHPHTHSVSGRGGEEEGGAGTMEWHQAPAGRGGEEAGGAATIVHP